jgi:dTDP-4-dehydrorhamnose 3,5-epimerase
MISVTTEGNLDSVFMTHPGGIDGVHIYPKRVIEDDRGMVRHGLRETDEHAGHIGEVYFSTVWPDVLKAWHLHGEMTLRYLCVEGSVWVGLYDDRNDSPTKGNSMLVKLDNVGENYRMLVIPPGVWNGFQENFFPSDIRRRATICNIASLPHDPNAIIRVSPDTINEKWGLKWPMAWRVGG